MSATGAVNGSETRFNHGEEATGHDLSLAFVKITGAQLTEVRDHYKGQDGGHKSFQFPPIIWQGHSSDSDIVPITGRWKYVGPPEETHRKGGLHDVVVQFQYVGSGSTS